MTIFLAAPFTDHVTSPQAGLEGDYAAWLKQIIFSLEEFGHEVLSAHRSEAWGKAIDAPAVALKRDFEWIKRSDLLIAYVGHPPSPGVQMELGYASALRLPLIVFRHDSSFPYLLDGLASVTSADVVTVQRRSDINGILRSMAAIRGSLPVGVRTEASE